MKASGLKRITVLSAFLGAVSVCLNECPLLPLSCDPGEAMEKGLRDCCRSMRIGKILIRRHRDSKEPQVYYAKFPPNIENRKILLLLPVLGE